MVVAQVFLVGVVVVVVVVGVVVVDSMSKIFKNDQVEPNLVLEVEMKREPKTEPPHANAWDLLPHGHVAPPLLRRLDGIPPNAVSEGISNGCARICYADWFCPPV